MRRNQLLYAVILVPLDYLLLIAAAITAHRLRFETLVEIRPAISLLPFPFYLKASALIAVAWIAIFAVSGLYAIERPRRILQEIVRVISACTVGIMGLIIWIFFQRELFTSRFVILAAWLISIAYVIAGRLVIRLAAYFLFKSGVLARRVIIVGGDDPTTKTIVAEFSKHPEKGYVIVKRCAKWDEAAAREVDELMKASPVDEIFVTDPGATREMSAAVIDFAEDRHLTFRYAADTLASHAVLLTTTIAGIPIIEVARTRLEGWGRVYKRIFDLIASVILIALTSPVMLLVAAAVALESRGPVIYRNERIGKQGRPFRLYKFRSMYAQFSVGEQFGDQKAAIAYEQQLIRERGIIKESPVYKIVDDPRISRVGKLIRKYSLDELPQLFNVLKGEMSLVGPRPHQPREVAKYQRHHRRVLMIKPGITGLAQVSGRRDLSFEDEVKLDVFYIENWTPMMDVALLFKTPRAAFRGKGAY